MPKIYPIGVICPCPQCTKNGFRPLVPLLFGVSWWNFTKIIEVTKALHMHRNFVIWGYLPLPCGYIHVQNHEKIYFNSEFKAVLLKLIANVQSDNSFLWCSKFTPLELSAPAPQCTKNGFWPLVPLLIGVSWWNFTKMIEVTKAVY